MDFIDKNFVKVTFLLKTIVKSRVVDLTNFFMGDAQCGNFKNFSPTIFWQKFRQSNFFTKELYYKSIWRKNILSGGKFTKFPHCERECLIFPRIFPWNQLRSIYKSRFHKFFCEINFKSVFIHTTTISRFFREIKKQIVSLENSLRNLLFSVWKSGIKSVHDFAQKSIFSVKSSLLLKIRFFKKWRDDANIRCHFWILRQISNQNKLWLVKTFISSVYIGSHQIKTNKKAANLIWTPHFCIIPKYNKKSYL